MANFTSLALENRTPQLDTRQLTTGPVAVTKPKPTIAQLRIALDAFNVKGTARALAFELLSYWTPAGSVFPSLATLAAGMGKKPEDAAIPPGTFGTGGTVGSARTDRNHEHLRAEIGGGATHCTGGGCNQVHP